MNNPERKWTHMMNRKTQRLVIAIIAVIIAVTMIVSMVLPMVQ